MQLLPHACMAVLQCWKGVLVPAVLRLGRIEWMRPTYHTKKHIYSVGYSAVRAVELSAMRGNFVECLCEVLEGPDRLAPVFRCEPRATPATKLTILCLLHDCDGPQLLR